MSYGKVCALPRERIAAEIVQFQQDRTLALRAFASLYHETSSKCIFGPTSKCKRQGCMCGGEYFTGYLGAKRLSWSMIDPLHRLLYLSYDEY